MEPGVVLSGRFVLEAEAASGGWGRVFRARDLADGAVVAVKVVERGEPTVAERFTRERRILAGLRHPGIVRYVAHDVTPDGRMFLVEEWVQGRTLAGVLAERGLELAEAVAVIRGVADALAAVHGCGIVHRDVKPENILVAGEDFDRPKLVDFGIAHHLEDGLSLTRTGAILGTPGYMSPEQARGAREIDARADVFALGCTLYECATGTPAFCGGNPSAVRLKILLEAVEDPRRRAPEIPAALARLMLRMLEKRPENRPADAGEVARELAALPALPAPAAGGPRRHEPAPTRPPEPGALTPALVTVILAASFEGQRGADLERLARLHGAALEILAGGTVVMKLLDAVDGARQAATAARCALALASLLRDRGAVVVGSAPAVAVAAVIERGVEELQRAMVRALFGGRALAEPAIVLDDTTALLLGDDFRLARDADGATLLLRAR